MFRSRQPHAVFWGLGQGYVTLKLARPEPDGLHCLEQLTAEGLAELSSKFGLLGGTPTWRMAEDLRGHPTAQSRCSHHAYMSVEVFIFNIMTESSII